MPHRQGISNREIAEEEAQERENLPPLDTGSPLPQDASGRVGEEPLEDMRDRHTSHKAGSRSVGQKEAGSRYPDRSAPTAHKVTGAFGKEPGGPADTDVKATSRPGRHDRDTSTRKDQGE